jgi:hypothetical protein
MASSPLPAATTGTTGSLPGAPIAAAAGDAPQKKDTDVSVTPAMRAKAIRGAFLIVGGALWALGIAFALNKAVKCTSCTTSSRTEKAVGVLLALVLGPFYFLYPLGSKTYCKGVVKEVNYNPYRNSLSY